jgi:predicted DNA-binding transcriptional regulator AlpA
MKPPIREPRTQPKSRDHHPVTAPPAVPAETSDPLDPLLRESEVRKLVPVSRSTLWRMVRREEFPRPVRISKNIVGYRRAAVAEYLRSCQSR